MGGRSRSSGNSVSSSAKIGVNASVTGSSAAGGNQIGVNASVTSAAAQVAQGGKPTINAKAMSDTEFMRAYKAQNPTQAQKSASYDYTDPRATNTGYSPSQNMNYKLDTGQRLTSKEQRMLDGMEQMQAPLAHDTVLHRGAHQNVLQALGVNNYDSMSQSQLSKALVGREWTTKSLTSTSYDKKKSPFLSGPVAGGREVIMKINAAKGTMATRVNPSQAEVVIGRNTNWRVTGVRFTGATAHPRASMRSMPVVELEVDVW